MIKTLNLITYIALILNIHVIQAMNSDPQPTPPAKPNAVTRYERLTRDRSFILGELHDATTAYYAKVMAYNKALETWQTRQALRQIPKPTPSPKPAFLIDDLSVDDPSLLTWQQEMHERNITDRYNQKLAQYQQDLEKWELAQSQEKQI